MGQFHGEVAQLGERCVRNAEVGSSILLFSTIIPRPTILRRPFLLLVGAGSCGLVRVAQDCGFGQLPAVSGRGALSPRTFSDSRTGGVFAVPSF